MVLLRVDAVIDHLRRELQTSITAEYTPRETAGSFALGTFITMLPTLGVGLILFIVLSIVFDHISKIALFASVVVFNPVVKWGVYVTSFALGVVIFGPIDGVTSVDVSLDAGGDILLRLLVGNLILAVIATACSYFVAYRIIQRIGAVEIAESIDEAIEEIADESISE